MVTYINMFTVLFLLLVVFVTRSATDPWYTCHRGTYLLIPVSGPEVCPACKPGLTYMPEQGHRNRECLTCTQIKDPQVEIQVRECNRTHDAEILCKDGFYRRRARNPRQQDKCVKCYECENPTRACQGYHDTVCCVTPNFDAVLNQDGFYVCKERPILCKPGEYLSTTTEQCLPCPPNTYMSETTHNNTECLLCQTETSHKRLVLQECNRTHPAIFGWETTTSVDETRTSVDGTRTSVDGTRTLTTVKVCGECEYIYTDVRDNTVTCLPCSELTYNKDPACNHGLQSKGRQLTRSRQNNKDTSNSNIHFNTEKHVDNGVIIGSLETVLGLITLLVCYWIVCYKRHPTRTQHYCMLALDVLCMLLSIVLSVCVIMYVPYMTCKILFIVCNIGFLFSSICDIFVLWLKMRIRSYSTCTKPSSYKYQVPLIQYKLFSHKEDNVPPHKTDNFPPHKEDNIPPHKTDHFPPHKEDNIPPHKTDHFPPHKEDTV